MDRKGGRRKKEEMERRGKWVCKLKKRTNRNPMRFSDLNTGRERAAAKGPGWRRTRLLGAGGLCRHCSPPKSNKLGLEMDLN